MYKSEREYYDRLNDFERMKRGGDDSGEKKQTNRRFKFKNIPKVLMIPALVLIFGFTLVSCTMCTAMVDVGEVAVVTELGVIKGVESNGFHFKSPLQQYNIIDVHQVAVSNVYSTATSDNQSLTQTITAQVAIDPEYVEDLYTKFKGSHMDTLVMPLLADAFKSATAGYSIEEVIANRGALGSDMLALAKAKLDPYGITVISVEVTNVELPEDYKNAVEARKVAEQERETAQVRMETATYEAETNRIISESLSDANLTKMMIEAWDGKLPLSVGESSAFDIFYKTTE